jgi:WD40 repeat protein
VHVVALVVGALLLGSMSSASAQSWSAAARGSGPVGAQSLKWRSIYDAGGAAAQVVAGRGGAQVFVVGGASDGPGSFTTVAYDGATGARLWVRRADRSGDTAGAAAGYEAEAAAVSPDGARVFVTGSSLTPRGFVVTTVAYDAISGRQLWISHYGRLLHGDNKGLAIAVSGDGRRVLVGGTSGWDIDSGHDFVTIAYDAESGSRQWARIHSGARDENQNRVSLAVSSDGSRVYLAGSRDEDSAAFAYETASGTLLWQRAFDHRYAYTVAAPRHALALSPDGSLLFVVGERLGLNGAPPRDFFTLAIDASTGATRWVRAYDGPAHGEDAATGVAVSPDGSRVVVTGQSAGGPHDFSAATIAYDTATGARLWVTRQAAFATVNDLSFAPDGTRLYESGAGDMLDTVALDPVSGARIWSADDLGAPGTSLAFAPDGTVFVTGGSFITVAY